jgi:diguanylate cyclase (GGDEF)-like protein/PAS domain S-box-containing protein
MQNRLNQLRIAGYFSPLRIALSYALFATLWIIFSDQLMQRLTSDAQLLSRLQTYKGLFFVTITTILVWQLVQRFWHSQNKLITALQDSQSRLNVIFDTVPCGIQECDLHGRITFSNLAQQEILDVQPNSLIGLHIWDYQPDESAKQKFKSFFHDLVVNQPQPELFVTTNITEDGQQKILEYNWDYIYDDAGALTGLIAVISDITMRKHQEERILHLAHYDTLTSLPNRFLSMDRLSQMLELARRNNHPVGVLCLDLDDFKKINESMGHDAGDDLLIQVAQRIQKNIHPGDMLGRLSGDEFIVLLAELQTIEEIKPIVENLIREFRLPFGLDGQSLTMTLSIGVAIHPDDGNNASQLLRQADAAMFYAKNNGRNTFVYYTESMNRNAARRLLIEQQMYGALERGEFYLLYQPQIELATGNMTGAEALLRWQNDQLGPIGPDEFIPIAEQTGLIVSIGEFVMHSAIQMTSKWQKLQPNFRMAINLSPCQFRDPGLLGFVEQQLQKYQIQPNTLELEITEGVLLSGYLMTDELFQSFTVMGIEMAMDDFGTGYSSLSYLRRYPFAILKIDRSFINDLTTDSADWELVNASIAMAHALGLKVVAEGVETEKQANSLKTMQCDYVQGYFYSRPISADELNSRFSLKAG